MTRWYTEKKREHFYKQAKAEGYRARSAYKLLQIQKRFQILKEGDKVVDLGAAPGGWSQVARNIVGSDGTIIGIDLEPIQTLKDVTFIIGDIADETTIAQLHDLMGNRSVDVVLSDLSPNISGNYSIDHAQSVYLCQQAAELSYTLLKHGGTFVCKMFEGELIEEFITEIRQHFARIKRFSPNATRKSSSEIFIIAKQFIK